MFLAKNGFINKKGDFPAGNLLKALFLDDVIAFVTELLNQIGPC